MVRSSAPLFAAPNVDRRAFLQVIFKAAASIGVTGAAARRIASAAAKGKKPSVIWLHFQDCTGCSESLLRTSHPDLADLIFDLISLDYHETLMAASGHQAEAALQAAMKENDGKYICVAEGAIPQGLAGNFLKIAGKKGVDLLEEVGSRAALVVAIGSCASWGGVPSADPNPTGATGVSKILKGKPVVNLPGCPANPYILLGTVLQFAVMGKLPALDGQGRPMFAYGRVIHEHCPRRPHFDAGRFASQFGDEGHRLGYCLYKLGCKGPQTHASCSTNHFCEVVDAWPIGLGAPCFGCTEQKLAFRVPMFETVPIDHPTPPGTYAPIAAQQGSIDPLATGVAGGFAGALVGAGLMASKKFGERRMGENPPPERKPERKKE
ncbi:MAG TPA: hydrogenase 2 small subunit [Solibacterales bacterium]|nr:hydrogenase 2 small subunit [Bryobacterales bacterium]